MARFIYGAADFEGDTQSPRIGTCSYVDAEWCATEGLWLMREPDGVAWGETDADFRRFHRPDPTDAEAVAMWNT